MATGKYLNDASITASTLAALDPAADYFLAHDASATEAVKILASQVLNRLLSTGDVSWMSALANIAAVDSANDKFIIWDASASALKTLTATEILDRILTTADISSLSAMTSVGSVDSTADAFLLWDDSAAAFVALTASEVVNKLWQGAKTAVTTTPYSVSASTSGRMYHNTGATISITMALPPATVGLRFTFVRVANYDVVLDPDSTETVNGATTYTITQSGRVDLECFIAGQWVVTQSTEREWSRTVNVIRYGAKGDGTTDDSAAINAASTAAGYGGVVIFPPTAGSLGYKASALTVSSHRQTWIGFGLSSEIIKGGNGDLLTVSGDYFTAINMNWRGESASPSYTGNNVVISGAHPVLRDCSSRWAYARALKATGGGVRVYGTGAGGVWQTADAGGTGYDIEIGVSGTATLYHQLIGIYTGQSTGGVLLIDTGSHAMSDSQIGKLYLQKGTGPSGVNGGSTVGNRILGDVTVECSNASFSSNAFGTVNFTFAATTGGSRVARDNIVSNVTFVNNGSATNLIERSLGDGSTYTHTILATGITAGNGLTQIIWGTGSPETHTTASPGDIYLSFGGGAGTTLYVKESGTSTNTGWVAK